MKLTKKREIHPHERQTSIPRNRTKSALSTKLYNKTLELEANTGKFYIKDTWVKAGLCDLQKVTYEYRNPKTKETEIRSKQVCVMPGTAVEQEIPIEGAKIIDIWRVEFSMNSEGRKWIGIRQLSSPSEE